jgi:hypothetical protein
MRSFAIWASRSQAGDDAPPNVAMVDLRERRGEATGVGGEQLLDADPMGHDGLVASVINTREIARDLARLAIGNGLLAYVRCDIGQRVMDNLISPFSVRRERFLRCSRRPSPAASAAVTCVQATNASTLTLGQGQAISERPHLGLRGFDRSERAALTRLGGPQGAAPVPIKDGTCR